MSEYKTEAALRLLKDMYKETERVVGMRSEDVAWFVRKLIVRAVEDGVREVITDKLLDLTCDSEDCRGVLTARLTDEAVEVAKKKYPEDYLVTSVDYLKKNNFGRTSMWEEVARGVDSILERLERAVRSRAKMCSPCSVLVVRSKSNEK